MTCFRQTEQKNDENIFLPMERTFQTSWISRCINSPVHFCSVPFRSNFWKSLIGGLKITWSEQMETDGTKSAKKICNVQKFRFVPITTTRASLTTNSLFIPHFIRLTSFFFTRLLALHFTRLTRPLLLLYQTTSASFFPTHSFFTSLLTSSFIYPTTSASFSLTHSPFTPD